MESFEALEVPKDIIAKRCLLYILSNQSSNYFIYSSCKYLTKREEITKTQSPYQVYINKILISFYIFKNTME